MVENKRGAIDIWLALHLAVAGIGLLTGIVMYAGGNRFGIHVMLAFGLYFVIVGYMYGFRYLVAKKTGKFRG